MRKISFVIFIWNILTVLVLVSIWLFGILPFEYKGIPVLYSFFMFNFGLGSLGRGKENAWFKKTDFRLKKIILYDFKNDPHIPIRVLYHQLLSYLFLLIGVVMWAILYILFLTNNIGSDNPARYTFIFISCYCVGAGGALLIVMSWLAFFDHVKYKGEYFVDSKWIR